MESGAGICIWLSEWPGLVPPFTHNGAAVWMINYIVTRIKWLKYHIYMMNHRLQNVFLLYSVQKLMEKKRKSKLGWGLRSCFIVFPIGLQLLATWSFSIFLSFSYSFHIFVQFPFCLPYCFGLSIKTFTFW